MKKIEAGLLILCMTFVGMYASFYIIKDYSFSKSDKIFLYKTKWYHLFESYEEERSYIAKDDWVGAQVEAFKGSTTNSLLSTLRPKVIFTTVLFFLISLMIARRVYYKNANIFIVWFFLVGFFLVVYNTFPLFPF